MFLCNFLASRKLRKQGAKATQNEKSRQSRILSGYKIIEYFKCAINLFALFKKVPVLLIESQKHRNLSLSKYINIELNHLKIQIQSSGIYPAKTIAINNEIIS